MKALVLCAGFGTRLGELTREIPKPMLPIEGRPILWYILKNLAAQGIRQVAINLHFRPDDIRDYFGDGSGVGVSIHYVEETSLLGTAGSVRNLGDFLGDDDFLVQYGDVLTDQEFGGLLAQHRESRALATLVAHRREQSNSYLVMDPERRITQFHERPESNPLQPGASFWVNSGIQVLSPAILTHIPPDGPADLPRDVYVKLVEQGGAVYGFPLTGYRCAVDSRRRYEKAGEAIRSGRFRIREAPGAESQS